MKNQPNDFLSLTNWLLERPDTPDWLRYMHLPEENAPRAVGQIVRGPVQDLVNYGHEHMQEVVRDIMSGNEGAIYGICDRFHVAHMEMIKWIKTYLDVPKSKMNNVLDYYGKTGEFSYRLAKMTKCKVTYVDQDPWFDYARFRFRLHAVHYTIKNIQASPAIPRPDIEGNYGFISMLELPLEATPEWIQWYKDKLYPYGFVATCAKLPLTTDTVNPGPFKKVAILPKIGYIYQLVPDQA